MHHSLQTPDYSAYLLGLVVSLIFIVTAAACSRPKWELISSGGHPHTPTFLNVSFSNPDHGWGLTPSALFETNDGGRTWTSRIASDDGDRTFFDLDFVDGRTAFIVGIQRKGDKPSLLILRSNDAGKSWQDTQINSGQAVPNGLVHSISFCDSKIGWAVGANTILATRDGGDTWETQNTNDNDVLYSVTCSDANRAWAAGKHGRILYTGDGGRTWHSQVSGTTEDLTRIRSFGDDLWIVGGVADKGIVLHSHGGANWQSQPLVIAEPLFDIYVSGTSIWVAGANGAILRSRTGGQTWEREKSPTNNNLMSLFFLSPDQGWAGGDKMTLLRLSE
ncbi:MAG TPA: YCF48-related protein [Pyrinomonadaceae bacterium]|nr:YCF48-related protein [Pyrinomonadaceae bacterium]